MEYYKEESVAFNSYNEHYILSNMYPCDLIYKGAIFYGVDHLYHFLLFYRDKEIQDKIMKKCKGINANFQAKKIAEENKDKIEDITPMQRYSLLKKCIRLKAEQCRLFKEKLKSTCGMYLVEFAWWGDTEFGCVLKDGKYTGNNVTGRLMEEIRGELVKTPQFT